MVVGRPISKEKRTEIYRITKKNQDAKLTNSCKKVRFASSALASSSSVRLLGLRGGYPVRVGDGAVALPVEEKVGEAEMGSGMSIDGLIVVDRVVGVVVAVGRNDEGGEREVLMVEDSLQLVEVFRAVVSGSKVEDGAEMELAYEDEEEVVLIEDEDVRALVDIDDDSGVMELEGGVVVVFAVGEAPEPMDDSEDSAELETVCEREVVLVNDKIEAVPV
jgi:hypothetical protein